MTVTECHHCKWKRTLFKAYLCAGISSVKQTSWISSAVRCWDCDGGLLHSPSLPPVDKYWAKQHLSHKSPNLFFQESSSTCICQVDKTHLGPVLWVTWSPCCVGVVFLQVGSVLWLCSMVAKYYHKTLLPQIISALTTIPLTQPI